MKAAFDWFGPFGPIPNGDDEINAYRREGPRVDGPDPALGLYAYPRMIDLYKGEHAFQPVALATVASGEEPWYYIVSPIGFRWYYSRQKGKARDPSTFLHSMSWPVIEGIQRRRGHFLLFQPGEGLPADALLFEFIHGFLYQKGLPEWKCVYVTGNHIADELYRAWVGDRDPINIVSVENYQPLMSMRYERNPTGFLDSIPVGLRAKTYLCFNRRPRQHRIEVVDFLRRNDLLKQGLVSLPQTEEANLDLRHILPLVVDEPPDIDLGYVARDADSYGKTYFSVITETTMDETTLVVSEKIWKPMINYHPFVVLGSRHTLKLLRDLGYRTFDLDESYDEIRDPRQRLEMAMAVVLDLCSWTKHTLNQWYHKQAEILIHNRKLLLSRKLPYGYDVLHQRLFSLLR